MLLQILLQTLIVASILAISYIIYNIIKGITTYAVVKPITGTARLPKRVIRHIKGYFKDKKFRKELKAIKRAGDKERLLADMKNPKVLEYPAVKKFSLEREKKINKAKEKEAKKKGKDNLDKVI